MKAFFIAALITALAVYAFGAAVDRGFITVVQPETQP